MQIANNLEGGSGNSFIREIQPDGVKSAQTVEGGGGYEGRAELRYGTYAP